MCVGQELSFEAEAEAAAARPSAVDDVSARRRALLALGAPPLEPAVAVRRTGFTASEVCGLPFDRFAAVFDTAPDLATLGAARDLMVGRRRQPQTALSSGTPLGSPSSLRLCSVCRVCLLV